MSDDDHNEGSLEERLKAIPPLSPTEITPTGHITPPIPTEVKGVERIEGRPIEEWERDFKRDHEAWAEGLLTEDEKRDAIKRENEMLDLERENLERRQGNTPLRLIARYKMEIAGAALLTTILKLVGCF